MLRQVRRFHVAGMRLKAQILDMPAMSPTMTEGGIVQWAVKPGMSFTAGDVLLDIETDKAQISVEAQDDGILAKIMKDNGAKEIQVGTPIAVLCDPEDDPNAINFDELLAGSKANSKQQESEPAPSTSSSPAEPVKPAKEVHLDQVWLPSVIHLAHTYGIDPKDVKGTGPKGRVLKGDVLAALGKIPKSAPSDLMKSISKLQHLDLSYEPSTPSKPVPKKEAPKPVKIEVDISLDSLAEASLSVDRAITKASRLAIRDSILAVKPKASVLRSSALDKLCAPKNKVPFTHDISVLKIRGSPFLIQASVEYSQGSGAELQANMFIERAQYYLTIGVPELLV